MNAAKPMRVFKVLETEVPNLSEQIRAIREAKGISLGQAAKSAKMSKTHWLRIERGQGSLPIETLRNIEQAIGVNFNVDLD